MLLACKSAAFALTIACAGFAWHTVDALCDAKGKQLVDQAEFIAWQAGPILALRDAEAGQRLLASFWSNPSVEEARLYDNDRRLLAAWGEQNAFTAPVTTPKGYHFIGFAQVETVRDVSIGSQQLGTIYVRAKTPDLKARFNELATFTASVFSVAMLAVVIVAGRLHRSISRPLVKLTSAAQQATIDVDSTSRVDGDARGELKTLQDAFNHMLDRVQACEAEVRAAHLGLEDSVIARTKELSREIRSHQKSQAELLAAKDAAEAANRAKTQLMASRCRQVREPLCEITRLTEVLLDESTEMSPADRQECLSTIYHRGTQLVETIDQLLDGSKLETVACGSN